MYLNFDDDPPRGLFYILEGAWTPVSFFGSYKPEGFDFSAESEEQKPLGHLQGQFADKVFVGKWMPAGSNQAEPIRASEAPKIGCAGDGKWKRFDRPDWSFSFNYPATWSVVEVKNASEKYISLTCPDPGEMIGNNDVYLNEGTGKPSELVRCGNSWRYDADCDQDIGDSAFNHVPATSIRNGMEILDVSGGHEWRAYCRNQGYVGQTEGTDVFVLSGKSWIEISKTADFSNIVERIVKSVRPRKAR